MIPSDLFDFSLALLQRFDAAGLKLATAESCTGGLIAGCLTAVPGSSTVVERGFVTYSNEAKTEMLGVPADLIRDHGAVSAEVAEAMAQGALDHSRADVAIAVTGIAGPGGATSIKLVGLVFLAVARRGRDVRHERHVFPGDRQAVRLATVRRALEMLEAVV
ncbi:MAG TPA: CinA family protein [Azospirillaceae bacterium]|nr:CinA family protein [Azospirillaceae bacterium]